MNLNFDNKLWLFIFIIGFVMVLLTSKCLCNRDNFASSSENDKITYTIFVDKNNKFVLGDSNKAPILINENNIFITVISKIKNIKDLYDKLSDSKSSPLNMTYKDKKNKDNLLLLDFLKKDISLSSGKDIITINTATKYKPLLIK